jgi:type VI secretion system protein ImpG
VSKSLHEYYEAELVYLRQTAQEFARQFPATANRLLLEANRSLDPHVERLLEGFAFLTGRVQHKLDDEFPELTDALLSVLYPHYLAPVPSMAIVQFDLDPERAQLPDGFKLARHSPLHSARVGGVECKFRTGYETTLWPVAVTEARLQQPPFPQGWQAPPKTRSALRLQIETTGELPFSGLSLDRLRLYLSSENAVVANFYEQVFNHALQVVFRPLDNNTAAAPFVLRPEEALFPVGFEAAEGLLPYTPQSFPGYRLLTEFFTFPSKFWFIDLGGFRRARAAGFQRKLEVVVFLDRKGERLESIIDASMFRTGCVPIVNLFEQTAEPIPLTQTRSEYRVVPDVAAPEGTEVHSILSVTSVDPAKGTTEYHPFYSFRHGGDRRTRRTFWYAVRRPVVGSADRGYDTYLNLVDLDFDPHVPAEKSLVVWTLCTNRDLPTRLPQAGEEAMFELELAAPVRRINCLRAPSLPLRPPVRRGAYWRLVSHLALNHLSLTDPEEGRTALRELLSLYDFTDPEAGQQQALVTQQLVEGVMAVRSRPVIGRTGGPTASGFCRGTEITVEFDFEKYVGVGVYLFASVLERFLALYASVNSFTQLVAMLHKEQLLVKKWPPRAGEQPLL